MAGAIAEGVIGKITEMIIQQAAQEAALVRNFTRHFEWLKDELTSISGCLKYADSRAAQDEPVKRWLHRVRDVAWDAEDIVEECAVRPLYTSTVTRSCVYNPDELLFRSRMGKRIEEVRERISSITKDGERLRLFRELVPPSHSEQPSSSAAGPSSSAAGGEVWKGNSLPPRDSRPVAIESKLQQLISFIEQSTKPVITVVGMPGAGKTFLLQNLFHSSFKEKYKHSIWLSISQSYFVRELQLDLASQIGDLKHEVIDVSKELAAKLIYDSLQGQDSLIVLDDVWRADKEHDIIRNLGLPIGSDGRCKVLVTTRSKEVCKDLGASPYDMELLSEKESWQLFCSHAFGGDLPPFHLKEPPLHLREVALQVEKKCARLPLALKIIGASLSGCTDITQWESKLRQLGEVIDLKNDSGIQFLRLSYNSLPADLKPCFSYLSIFPENENIDCEYVVNLWIAEGLIRQGKDQWEVGWGYLNQLADRCFLEVWEDEGLFKYCKIHDLLRDLAIDISKENRYTFVVDDVFTSRKRSGPWCRIFLAKKEIDDKVIAKSRVCCPRSLRTVSLYSNPISKIEANFFGPMRLLRVLDLSFTEISTLPRCVGKLKLLKLLNLSWTKIEKVPICVRRLKSLVLLNLFGCQELQMLPEWISELRCLQHLNIKLCADKLRSHMPKGISELVSLRVLRSDRLRLSVEEYGLLKLEDVAKLTGLQELSLQVQHAKELKSIENGILAQLVKMRHLSIQSDFPTESHLEKSITDMVDLRTLRLNNFVVPELVCNLTNLRQVILWNCGCKNYPQLQTMPNLIKLRLVGNESCRELPKAFGDPSGFPKLRVLTIKDFPDLEEFPDLQNEAMAVLEEFTLDTCPKVKKVPEGLERLGRLRLFSCGETGTDKFRKTLSKVGDVRQKIEATNPHVRIELGYDLESFSRLFRNL